MEKEKIIESIASRINVEYIKHKKLDWCKIAAHKIYSTLNDLENKDIDNNFIKNFRLDKIDKIFYYAKIKSSNYFWKCEKKYFFNLFTRKEGIYTCNIHGGHSFVGNNKKNYVVIDDVLYLKPNLVIYIGNSCNTIFFNTVKELNNSLKYIKENSNCKWYEKK